MEKVFRLPLDMYSKMTGDKDNELHVLVSKASAIRPTKRIETFFHFALYM